MRFKLSLELEPQVSGREIPINYQYELASVVYKIIANGDNQYSDMLHSNGFVSTTKHFKLFTFSNLIAPNRGIELKKGTDRLIVKSNTIEWYLGFVPEDSTQRFVQGVFTDQRFRLADNVSGAWFKICEVQLLPGVDWTPDTEFETISPVSVSKRVDDKKYPIYISPEDPTYETALLTGLLERYKAINGREYEGEKYCRLTVTNVPKSALITIKAGTKDETRVRGFRYRFKIALPQELMEIAYECGLGERGSMGFGMIKERKEK